jgi:antitoxin component of MazEF toxin-antitoxin module
MRQNNGSQKVMEIKRIGSAYAIIIDEDMAEEMNLYDGQVLNGGQVSYSWRNGMALKDAVKKG